MKVLLHLYWSIFLTLLSQLAIAQTVDIGRGLWRQIDENQLSTDAADRQIVPEKYRVLELDIAAVKQLLQSAPTENEVLSASAAPLIMEFPHPDGGFTQYQIYYFSAMHPDLQAQYPEIRSYAGVGIDDPLARVFFDISPKGFHAMTLRNRHGSIFIDPYAKNDTANYLVYYKRDFIKKPEHRMICEMDDMLDEEIKAPLEEVFTANCGVRREYRLALACTGEYAQFHGGTTALALAAMNTSMTRVNGVYVTEASIKMNIIANNNLIIYLNGATDPYTNNNGSTMLTENQNNLTAVIGSANYDIGHVFSTGGGGVAVLNSPCSAANKAKGVTGGSSPVGDPFDIDYVAHEMGHQYGGSHTFSSSVGSCSGNGSAGSAYEPGSGSTIMAYAGICGGANVQPNSDAYFHARSLLQMSNFVTGAGHTCDTEISSNNAKPTVATMADVTYPKSTPFVLNGSATDPNGNAIAYCWEQYNAALVSPPAAGNTSGPLFRTFEAVPESYRYFPSFDNIHDNTTDMWEVLPGVSRTLTFRLTARDNVITGGCTDEKDINVVIAGAAGPFAVTAPNGGEVLEANSMTTITWDVAGTNANGVNCANVDILYSTTPADPTSYIMLLATTPNDGTQAVTVPNVISTTVRIMIRCSSTNGTFFYDISNANFTIDPPTVSYCYTFTSTDVPKTIPLTASPNPIISNLPIAGMTSGTITGVRVTDLNILHTYDRELSISLQSPNGTNRILLSSLCLDNDNIDLKFDDNAVNTYAAIPCPPTSGLYYQPFETLAGFNGGVPTGTWQLKIVDNVAGNGGSLESWGLEVCMSQELLPVELLSFGVTQLTGKAFVQWETATERNNKGFYIERSIGDAFNFVSIGFVPATQNPKNKNPYQFTDDQIVPGNTYYYRLRQEDWDGTAHFSDIESVSFDGSQGILKVSPNPSRTSVSIQIEGLDEKELEIDLKVYNTAGQLVYQQQAAQNTVVVSHWPAGVYTFQAIANRKTWVGKLVKY